MRAGLLALTMLVGLAFLPSTVRAEPSPEWLRAQRHKVIDPGLSRAKTNIVYDYSNKGTTVTYDILVALIDAPSKDGWFRHRAVDATPLTASQAQSAVGRAVERAYAEGAARVRVRRKFSSGWSTTFSPDQPREDDVVELKRGTELPLSAFEIIRAPSLYSEQVFWTEELIGGSGIRLRSYQFTNPTDFQRELRRVDTEITATGKSTRIRVPAFSPKRLFPRAVLSTFAERDK